MSRATESDAEAQSRLLEPLSTKWIENASGASRDTVAAWRKGRTPRADQWERFLQVLTQWQLRIPVASGPGTERNAPAEAGAADELLGLWTGSKPPRWAEVLTDQIIQEVRGLRGEATEEAARQAVRAAGTELRKQIHDGLARGDEDSSRNTRGEPAAPQP